MDNSLRVDPLALVDGAQQFRQTHEQLRDVLAKIDSGHEALRGRWIGGAAAKGATMWADLSDAFGAHVDKLAETADRLHSAAGQYRGQDESSGTDINRQM